MTSFRESLVSGLVVLVLDGSLLVSTQESATHSWKLHDRTSQAQADRHGWVTSGGQEMSLLRAEIGGFLGGISAISHILNLEPPIPLEKRVPLPVYLDNSALISRIEQWKYNGPTGALRTDYDLLQPIIHAISQRITKRFDPAPYKGSPTRWGFTT